MIEGPGIILILGEGPRDEATVPPLVASLLGREVKSRFEAWKDSHVRWKTGQQGLNTHGRKLLLAIKATRADGGAGVIATQDHDKGREDRRGDMQRARDRDRETQAPIPVAIGVPVPHIEAWLLDDAVAVREGLALEKKHPVPNLPDVSYPKDAMTDLFKQSPRAHDGGKELDALGDIAGLVSLTRSAHKGTTGLGAFHEDLAHEFRAVDESPAPTESAMGGHPGASQ